MTDSNGDQATGIFVVTVEPPLTITTTSLPPATPGVAFSAQLTANGGNPPYRWRLVRGAGTLPKGLHLDHDSGVISGTPTKKAATSTFTVEVKDSKTTAKPRTRTAQATLSITVS